MDNLSLEDALSARARKDLDADDLFVRYQAMKAYLAKDFYPWVQAECPYFTDHGILHVESVLQAVASLVSPHLRANKASELTSLDIFLLMTSVLWHDVGNVYGRSGHAEKVAAMTQEVRRLGFPNPDIQRLVAEIALAHSGEDGLTKPRLTEDVSTANKQYTVDTRSLAAIVRFADEISENQARISLSLLPSVPKENRIYWEYAGCVTASIAVVNRHLVRVSVTVPHDAATVRHVIAEGSADSCQRSFANSTGKPDISLIEYIICRLEKMNNERAYCAPRFARYADIRQIELSLTLTRDNARVTNYSDVVVLGDGGLHQQDYPHIALFKGFFEEHERWKPDEIEKALAP